MMNFRISLCALISLFALLACNEHGEHEHHNDNDVLHVHKKESAAATKKKLTDAGFQIFDYVDDKTGDTILMQEYFMVFLKRGPNQNQTKEITDSLQVLHRAHLGRMYDEGYADISGPFGDNEDLRGISIYNVPNIKMADSLANLDPMVRAGRLVIETRSWWAAKGFGLR